MNNANTNIIEIQRWDISDELLSELDNHYKTEYALTLKNESPLVIAKALTFDHLANTITISELERFLDEMNTIFLSGGIRGVGLEVGSGPGTFVGVMANMNQVEKVIGIDACQAIIKELMVPTVKGIAPEYQHKIIGAVADFNSLSGLENNSVDFVFDFFSLHHSPNPIEVLSEVYRVLKPGGVIFCIDKARANTMTDTELESLLEIEYSSDVKKSMGLPENKFHTRRMNGENEYRLKDWEKHFKASGFNGLVHYNVAKIAGKTPVRLLKALLSHLPPSLQVKFSPFFSRKITNNLEPSNRIFTQLLPSYPREFSLLIAKK